MTAKDLKNALLQEAVQGKLVPQIATEGNARDLLEEIRKEKVKLVKEGKIKKEKPLPEITEEDIPFDIPENWCWCRLGEIVDTNIGLTYTPSDVITDGGTGVLRSNNIQNGKIVYDDLVHVSKSVPEKCLSKKGDLLICARNGSKALVGKSALIEKDGMAFGAFMAIVRSPINPYILHFINSPVYRAKLDGVNTTTINQITQDNLRETLLPLPPLAEQKRIVAAIEKFMPLIEEYGKKETELKSFNEQIGTLTKKAILQEAVQGKLVPQIATEGNAKDLLEEIKKGKAKLIKDGKIKKEKPLPEISDDEIPFEIPENWCWCRLGDICNVRGGKRIPAGRKLTKENTGHKYIRVTDMKNGTVLDNDVQYITDDIYEIIKAYTISKDDVYITVAGTIGQAGTIPEFFDNANLTENADKLELYNTDKKFLVLMLSSPYIQKQIHDSITKVGQPKLAIMRIQTLVIALPPLAEQKRIVAAIEKILPLCEKIGE